MASFRVPFDVEHLRGWRLVALLVLIARNEQRVSQCPAPVMTLHCHRSICWKSGEVLGSITRG